MSVVERLLSDFEIDVSKRDFREHCLIIAHIKKDLIEDFNMKASTIYGLDIIIGNE